MTVYKAAEHYTPSIHTPTVKLVILGLVHRVHGNIKMGLLPGRIDVPRLAHAAIVAHATARAACENWAFVDNHECQAICGEWVSVGIERCKVEAKAAGLTRTASARS